MPADRRSDLSAAQRPDTGTRCPVALADDGKQRSRDWMPVSARAQSEAMNEHSRLCAGRIMTGGFEILYAHGCRFLAVPPIGRFVAIKKILYLQEPHRRLYEAAPRCPGCRRTQPPADSLRPRGCATRRRRVGPSITHAAMRSRTPQCEVIRPHPRQLAVQPGIGVEVTESIEEFVISASIRNGSFTAASHASPTSSAWALTQGRRTFGSLSVRGLSRRPGRGWYGSATIPLADISTK